MAITLPYEDMEFVPLDILTAQEQNQLVANIEYLAGVFPVQNADISNGAISTSKIEPGAVTNTRIDFSTLAFGNYSTTEQDTGFTWVDGKHIYKKTIDFGALPNIGSKTVSLGVTIDRVIEARGFAKYPTGIHLPIPHITTLAGGLISMSFSGNNTLEITTGTDRSEATAYVTVFYTKA